MTNREKVINGLKFTKAMITFNPSTGEDIEPGNLNEADKTTYDACVGAIALLKEQEPVKPRYTPPKSIYSWECGVCAEPFDRIANYCPKCGRRVKWE